MAPARAVYGAWALLLASCGSAQPDVLALVQGSIRLHAQDRDEAALLRLGKGAGSLEGGEGAEESVGGEVSSEEELGPKAGDADTEGQHRQAVSSANEATRRISAAKEKMQKAEKYLKFADQRIQALEQENATAVQKLQHAHEKSGHYASKGVSYRAKQAEVESLKGKHVIFDKAAYAKRMKEGNMSRYGLYTTTDEKQHFGEKTWDILSNHIFGLDKLMKNINNASTMETKSKQYSKLERKYAAQQAAAQEEILEVESKAQQAEKDIEDAKKEIEAMLSVKSEAKAMQREVRKKMVQEKRGKSPAGQRRARRAAQRAEKAAKEAEEAEAEAAEASEDAEQAEEAEEAGEAELAEASEDAEQAEEAGAAEEAEETADQEAEEVAQD